jgi:hypothetical protein
MKDSYFEKLIMKWDRPEGPNHSSKRRTKVIVVEFLLS